MILAGDVGGTKAQLALFENGAGPRSPVAEKRLPTRGSPSLDALVRAFLDETHAIPDRMVFGIAGPVEGNRGVTTNLPWQVDGDAMSEMFHARVTLLNDLEATAWGLGTLGPDDLGLLQRGEAKQGNRALIAAGTGLGEALLHWEGDRWQPIASEGGHADLAARDAFEDELVQWLRAKYGHVSRERVLSGPGLADLYRFHRQVQRGQEPAAIATRFDQAEDPGAVVTETGLDGSCERARLTLERFCVIYGAEAGNLALEALALGGVFLGGGIAPRLLALLQPTAHCPSGFLAAFVDKGRLAPLLAGIPVAVVLDPRTAVWGAAAYSMAQSQN